MFVTLQEILPGENLVLGNQVKLIHGQAYLYEDDLRIKPMGSDNPEYIGEIGEWFAPKKRAMLAPLRGVGTIDQAELVVFKYLVSVSPLGWIGLAGKVLILDEVHASDRRT